LLEFIVVWYILTKDGGVCQVDLRREVYGTISNDNFFGQ